MSGKVRVRFAPSPTGELHIGGARTALFNYFFARKYGGVFALRIDDTDRERSRSDYTEALLDALRWLGLDWDEGPYYQSEQFEKYNREASRLMEEGKAYHCYCSAEELEAGRNEARKAGKQYLYPGRCRNLPKDEERAYLAEGRSPVIRVITPDEGFTVVEDIIRGRVTVENNTLDDFIIIKSNGLPTYNFASIVDDHQLAITHIIRAEEHLSNTPRQQICAEALGYELPEFAHVPMILAPDRSKLSKRHGATSVEEFREKGYLPEALTNYMALLGWSPGEEEICPPDKMISLFSLEKVNKTAAIYDTTKLTWLNGHYIREGDLNYIVKMALPFFVEEGLLRTNLESGEEEYLKRVVAVIRDRVKTLAEMPRAAEYFYKDIFEYDEKGVKKGFMKEGAAALLRKAANKLHGLDIFNKHAAEEAYRELQEELGIPAGRLIQPSRLALSGRTSGPGLFEMMEVLNRGKTVQRLKQAADYIEQNLC